MKKIVLFLIALLLVTGGVDAKGNKNISKARSIILSEKPNLKTAKSFIAEAMKDSNALKEAKTWYYSAEVYRVAFEQQNKLNLIPAKANYPQTGQDLKMALKYYVKAIQVDNLPNEKGKIKPKYTKKIIPKVKQFQLGFIEPANQYYKNKKYKEAMDMFEQYLSYYTTPELKGIVVNDTIRNQVEYFAGLSATQAKLPKKAIPHYELIKDSTKESHWIYQRLAQDYTDLKDTVNMIRMFQLGSEKFPKDSYFSSNLINYYVSQNKMDEALEWINKSLKANESAPLYNIKGMILENDSIFDQAIIAYKKAIEISPEFTNPYANIGRVYFNKADVEFNKISSISLNDTKKYNAAKEKVKSSYEKALPFYKKAHELKPDNKEYIRILYTIYYRIDDHENYEKMEKLLTK